MNWFQENKFLGAFLGALSLTTLLCAWFLLYEKGAADEAQSRLEETINELTRLRRGAPFPNEDNLRESKARTGSYQASLRALESELKSRMFPELPLQPNEFQAQLRLASIALGERAAPNKIPLPANFYLGFDEYATSLPNREAAPPLGRQLRAIEWILSTMIEAHVDTLNSLTRSPLPEEKAAPGPTTPSGASHVAKAPRPAVGKKKIVDRASFDVSFSSSAAAARRVFNQISAAKEQFYVIRTLLVRNQVDKGPKRDGLETAAPPAPGAKAREPGITFIVGTEHIEVAAKIEILKFTFPEKEAR